EVGRERSLSERMKFRSGLVISFVVTGSATAVASPSSQLTYVRGAGAESCPDEAELRKAVAARLGYDPFFPSAGRTIAAQIERTRGGFAGELKMLDASGVSRGERKLPTTSHDCAEVVKSLALAISIAIDDLDEPASVPASPSEPVAPSTQTPEVAPLPSEP